jgi:hypothetical protein
MFEPASPEMPSSMTQALIVVVIAVVASICAVTLAAHDLGGVTAHTRPLSARGGPAYAAEQHSDSGEVRPCAGYPSAH